MKAILESKADVLPVSVEYVKEHFALSESDETIKKLLTVAVEHIELQNGVSLVKKVWKIIHDNDYIVLNFGPIVKLLSVKDKSGNDIKPLNVKRAHDQLILQMQEADKTYCVRYEAGYDKNNLPDCLKSTILEKFWDLYSENVEIANDVSFGVSKSKVYNEVLNAKYAIKW